MAEKLREGKTGGVDMNMEEEDGTAEGGSGTS